MRSPDVEDLYPLSPQQQGMLFGTLHAPHLGRYVEQEHHTLGHALNTLAFRRAWETLLERHTALRAAFVWRDQEQPLQAVLRRVDLPLEEQDWRGLDPAERGARLRVLLAEDRKRGFDLSRAPLMRLTLLRTDDGHEFVWTLHHIVMDGWSRPLLVREFGAVYAALCGGREPVLAPPRPFRDYIAWLRRQDLAAARSFWASALSGFVRPTPLGRPDRPVEVDGDAYGTCESRVPAAALREAARGWRVTLGTVLHGVWALLLRRYSGDPEVVFGTTVSGRPLDLEGSETMIGLFVNTLPFRVAVPPAAPLAAWLHGLQDRHLELRRFEYCSAGQIHQLSGVPGSVPLYESLVVVENYPTDGHAPATGGEARFEGAQTAHALTILCAEAEDLLIRVVHDQRRVADEAAGRMLAHFTDLLGAAPSAGDSSLGSLIERIGPDEVPRVAPAATAPSRSRAYVAPRTDTERVVCRLCADVLGLDRIGVQDRFLELGGHSLVATQLMSRLRDTFQIELPLRVVFESRSLGHLAATVEEVLLEEIERLPEEEVERLLREQASTGAGAG